MSSSISNPIIDYCECDLCGEEIGKIITEKGKIVFVEKKERQGFFKDLDGRWRFSSLYEIHEKYCKKAKTPKMPTPSDEKRKYPNIGMHSRMPFGKYKGHTPEEIIDELEKPGYVKFLIDQGVGFDSEVIELCEKAM